MAAGNGVKENIQILQFTRIASRQNKSFLIYTEFILFYGCICVCASLITRYISGKFICLTARIYISLLFIKLSHIWHWLVSLGFIKTICLLCLQLFYVIVLYYIQDSVMLSTFEVNFMVFGAYFLIKQMTNEAMRIEDKEKTHTIDIVFMMCLHLTLDAFFVFHLYRTISLIVMMRRFAIQTF